MFQLTSLFFVILGEIKLETDIPKYLNYLSANQFKSVKSYYPLHNCNNVNHDVFQHIYLSN